MKKYLLFIFLLILIPNILWAAAFTSKATGNWTTEGATTWNEDGHPGNGDTVTINTTHTVTVDVDHDIGTTIVQGGLTIASGVTATASGALTIGNGAAKDGTLTFGAGSTLALGANNLVLNNSFLRSNSTTGSWAYVTGSGAITTGAVHTYPKQDIILSYVSFQNTGAITCKLSGTSGTGETNQAYISYCTFVGNGAITFGEAAVTPEATNISITYSDFRDLTGNIRLTGKNADITEGSIRHFKYNTLSNSGTYRDLVLANSDGYVVEGCVFDNNGIGGSTVNSASFTMSDSVLGTVFGSTSWILLNDGEDAQTVEDCYFYSSSGNPHFLGADGGANAGAGAHVVQRNVFESDYSGATDDSGNSVVFMKHALTVQRNIVLATGSRSLNGFYSASAKTSDAQNVLRNTVYGAANNTSALLVLIENDVEITGDINVVNNLVTGSTTITSGCNKITAGDNQVIAYAGYNDWDDVTDPYGARITLTVGPTNDVADVVPRFVDSTREFATWDGKFGSGTGTAVAGMTYLLAINGYNSGTKTQSDTPSARLPSHLVEWVRYGFSPTNGLLRETGDGSYIVDSSQTIGAMQWQNPRRKRVQ